MKVWIDANEIGMIHELPDKKLRQLDREMTKKPNFDKKEGEKGCFKHEKNKKAFKTYKRHKKSL